MPTLQSHTHCQAAQCSRAIQSLSKSVSEPPHGRQKRKHDCTTMAIRNAGFGAKLKVIAINKICSRLKGLWVQIPHSA